MQNIIVCISFLSAGGLQVVIQDVEEEDNQQSGTKHKIVVVLRGIYTHGVMLVQELLCIF